MEVSKETFVKIKQHRADMIAAAEKALAKMQSIQGTMFAAFQAIAFKPDVDHVMANQAFRKFNDKSTAFMLAREKLEECLRELR